MFVGSGHAAAEDAARGDGQRAARLLGAAARWRSRPHWFAPPSSALTELKNRGVNDVLMIVCDGLTGLPDAIATVWPQTITQTCIVHLRCNSFRYAGRQHGDAITKALCPVYTAPTEAAAMDSVGDHEIPPV